MNPGWLFCGIGILFFVQGIYLFYKKVFEEGGNISHAIIIMLLGVLLVGMGSYMYFFP